MRSSTLIVLLISFSFAIAQGQGQSFAAASDNNKFGDSIPRVRGGLDTKWSSSFYHGISTGFSFFNGGNFMTVAAPFGWQLNRRLNDNFYAFAGISAAPAYINFNQSFLYSDVNKNYPGNGLRANNFGFYARAEAGLMYVNDARTFSISASVGAQRGNNPLFLYPAATNVRTNPGLPQSK
jgi:hypothetical protein